MTKSILLISHLTPCRGHAGGLRLLDIYSQIRRIAQSIHLELLTCARKDLDWGMDDLNVIFDKIHWINTDQFNRKYLQNFFKKLGTFDVVDLQYHKSGTLILACKRRWYATRVIYSPMESMFRSASIALRKPGVLFSRGCLASLALIWRALQELIFVRRADKVVYVSEADMRSLSLLLTSSNFFCIPTCLSLLEISPKENKIKDTFSNDNNKQQTVVFVAYFGSETNREALIWYCKNVHTRLKTLFPNYEFRIVGRGLDEKIIQSCHGEGITFVGPVENLIDAIQGSCIGIAPALSGAGIRGKIHQYTAMGLPCVASNIACENLKYGDSILIANDADEFFEQCQLLLRNPKLRRQLAEKAMKICLKHYSWNLMDKHIAAVYELTR